MRRGKAKGQGRREKREREKGSDAFEMECMRGWEERWMRVLFITGVDSTLFNTRKSASAETMHCIPGFPHSPMEVPPSPTSEPEPLPSSWVLPSQVLD